MAVIREEQTAFNASSRSGVASDSKSRFELEAGSFFGEAALVSGDVYGRRTTSVQVRDIGSSTIVSSD